MELFIYDEKTKEYLGTKKANLDILESEKKGENVYLIPPNSTKISPEFKSLLKDEVFVYNLSLNEWERKKDFRNKKIYNKLNQSCKVQDEIGNIGEEYTLLEPGKCSYWDGEKWEKDIEKEKELNDSLYLTKISQKKMFEIIINGLIQDGIIDNKGNILKYEIDLEDNIYEMIKKLNK